MSLAIDGFSFVNLDAALFGFPSQSATVYLDNPTDIFVAQVALTSVGIVDNVYCTAYISGITLANGDHLEFSTFPTTMEWANTQSVTFVLEVQAWTGEGSADGFANALASVTNYREI